MVSDIVDYYPSILQDIVMGTLNLAKQHVSISMVKLQTLDGVTSMFIQKKKKKKKKSKRLVF